jgi:hypothetical protein
MERNSESQETELRPLTDAEVNAVDGGLVVIAIIAILIGMAPIIVPR